MGGLELFPVLQASKKGRGVGGLEQVEDQSRGCILDELQRKSGADQPEDRSDLDVR